MTLGPLTLIGSGEFSERLLNLHQTLLRRLRPPQIAFLDTPAGFQLNANELSATAAAFFKKHFNLEIATASYRNSSVDSAPAISQLLITNYLLAGPGSPTYAVNHWRDTAVWQTVGERWNAGAQLVFASSAAIALGRFALPVYEIYKVGADPFWAGGLNLLGPLGFDLAIIPHYDNAEGRTHDTRYCFMGEPRLNVLEKLLPPTTVMLGLDEYTACTLDFDSQTVAVTGAGTLTLRYMSREVQYPNGAVFPLDRLKPENALAQSPISNLESPAAIQASNVQPPIPNVPPKVIEWAEERNRLRAEKNFAEADQLRNRISAVGYAVKDSPTGPLFTLNRVPNPNAVPSKLDGPDSVEWSINLLAHNNRDEIIRAAQSALKWGGDHSIEVVIVDNGSDDGTAEAIAELAANDERVRPVHLASDIGEGAGRNAGFRASSGRFIMILGGHMEIM
ncbi:MAG TPA: glycosyltransferase, partial [Anaerolineales bacterium]|nr:glycosyltransferase [Anaerolineales bacterium]